MDEPMDGLFASRPQNAVHVPDLLECGGRKHAYWYLHFKVVFVQLDPNVGNGLLKKLAWPQNQDQLQVPRKSPL